MSLGGPEHELPCPAPDARCGAKPELRINQSMTFKWTNEPQCASAKILTRRPHPSLLRVVSRKGKHPGRAYRIKRWDRYEVGMSLLHCRVTAGLDHLDVLYYAEHGLMTLRDMTPQERREALLPWDGNHSTHDSDRASSSSREAKAATSPPPHHRARVEPVSEVQARPPVPGSLLGSQGSPAARTWRRTTHCGARRARRG